MRYYTAAGGKTKPKRGIDATRGTWQSRPLAWPVTWSGRQTARGADECGEEEDAKSEWLPVMGGIPVETSPAGATLADVHLVYERKKSR